MSTRTCCCRGRDPSVLQKHVGADAEDGQHGATEDRAGRGVGANRAELLTAEKEATRALDALAARRRELADSGASWATVSNMPLAQIEAYQTRMGRTFPLFSSHGTSFANDCGAGGGFVLTVFLRDGTDVCRTYSTTARGVDRLLFVDNILDLCPYGQQEDWEDSPPGWPHAAPHVRVSPRP
jgi:predicted dithiol-disulfide oxidoreductase (DUF899 family)